MRVTGPPWYTCFMLIDRLKSVPVSVWLLLALAGCITTLLVVENSVPVRKLVINADACRGLSDQILLASLEDDTCLVEGNVRVAGGLGQREAIYADGLDGKRLKLYLNKSQIIAQVME